LWALAVSFFLLVAGLPFAPSVSAKTAYDVVIRGGRLIDPESGIDAVRDVAIADGRIVAVSSHRLSGRVTIEADGLVVAPGFIDVHSHGMTIPNGWLQAFDGVTTALELETGAWPISDAYRVAAQEGRPIHYGYSVAWSGIRQEVMGDRAQELATDTEIAAILARVSDGLDAGGLGVGTPVGYSTRTNRTEYWDVAALAAKRGVPVFTHVRTKNGRDPGSALEAFEEVIATAATTGAHMHLCHINSSGLRDIPRLAGMIAKARSYGIPVTSEAYPWGAGSTSVGAPFLAPENLALLDIGPENIEVIATGERPKTLERLADLRKADPRERVLVHYLNEAIDAERTLIERALVLEDGIIASDAVRYSVKDRIVTEAVWPLPAGITGHPRSAATFTKVLGEYVRERGLLSLGDAIRRATLLPAQLLEPVAPGMKHKGRIGIGMDADIIVFDPATVGAAATYERPAEPARGMRHVLVGGTFVVRNGKLIKAARPGRAIRGGTIE
jgi:N-acyl-D-aspartate/D-glutamate deacylase